MSNFERVNKNALEEYWHKRWIRKDTPWHRDKVDDILVKYFHNCYPDQPPKRAFVPLCGKSTDMFWLAGKGCEVVGVEINRDVCDDFFKEHEINRDLISCGNIPVFKGVDCPITIYNCNIFDAPVSHIGKCDFIWDRGSIIAITKDSRASYYSLLKKLFGDSIHYLIEACVYDEREFSDFPMCLTLEHLEELIGDDDLKLEMLEEEDTTEISKAKFRNYFTYFKCVTYLISSK